MRNSLSAAIVCVFLLPQSHAHAAEDSFLLYAWACPDSEADKDARAAFVNLDQDAFYDTDCVSIRPDTKYRLLRCDPDILEEDLKRFGYEIERTEEVTLDRCEISVTNEDGTSNTYLIDYFKLPLLKP